MQILGIRYKTEIVCWVFSKGYSVLYAGGEGRSSFEVDYFLVKREGRGS